MYYPILKGKQNELNALRELIGHISADSVCPILEPVNLSFNLLATTIFSLKESGFNCWVVINPHQGEFAGTSTSNISLLLTSQIGHRGAGVESFIPCVKVRDGTDVNALNLMINLNVPFVAYVEGSITPSLKQNLLRATAVALNPSKTDQSVWGDLPSVVLFHDGFDKKSRNLDYGAESFYSSYHSAYSSCPNAIGFGDYTILGERFSEGGGPAYVVTLHLSYIASATPRNMYVRHFSSYSDNDSQSDPGGKFREALDLLVSHVSGNKANFVNTVGYQDFVDLHATQHYPGLGIVKKISIKHHIQTLSGW